MKSDQRYVMILNGYPGSGKTTLGKRLSMLLTYKLLCKSKVLYSLGFQNLITSSPYICQTIATLLHQSVLMHLENGDNCLLSFQNSRQHYFAPLRFKLYEAIIEKGGRIVLVDLVASHECLLKRIQHRNVMESDYKSISNTDLLDKNPLYDPLLDMSTLFSEKMSFIRFNTENGQLEDLMAKTIDEPECQKIIQNLEISFKEESALFDKTT